MKQLLGAIVLTILLAAQPAHAQVAIYDEGSIYDLQPSAVQSTGNRILEQVLNSNDMQQVSELAPSDILRKLARPVGRLAIQLPENKIAYCTASLIDRNLIVTNYHCIPGKGDVRAALLWMGYIVPQSRQGVAQYGVDLKPVEADKQLDYAILRVHGNPGDEWDAVRLSMESPTAFNSLFIVHHPGGFAQHISRGRCQTSNPAIRGDDLLHVCDTLGGEFWCSDIRQQYAQGGWPALQCGIAVQAQCR